MSHNFKSLLEFTDYFKSDTICREFLELKRWKDGIKCLKCGFAKVYRYGTRKVFRCGNRSCRKNFSATTGTIFHNSSLSLRKWFLGIYLFCSDPIAMSSLQLSKYLNVCRRTAWFVHHRIMEAFKHDSSLVEPLAGVWEMDEVWIGPSKRMISQKRHAQLKQGTGTINYTPIFGMLHRGHGLYGHVFGANEQRFDVQPILKRYAHPLSTVYSDASQGYAGLQNYFSSYTQFCHSDKDYGNGGEEHSNFIEGAFKHFKDRVRGRYKKLSPKYLQRYWDEYCFRYNTRHMTDWQRFELLFETINRPISYKELVSKRK